MCKFSLYVSGIFPTVINQFYRIRGVSNLNSLITLAALTPGGLHNSCTLLFLDFFLGHNVYMPLMQSNIAYQRYTYIIFFQKSVPIKLKVEIPSIHSNCAQNQNRIILTTHYGVPTPAVWYALCLRFTVTQTNANEITKYL